MDEKETQALVNKIKIKRKWYNSLLFLATVGIIIKYVYFYLICDAFGYKYSPTTIELVNFMIGLLAIAGLGQLLIAIDGVIKVLTE